MSKESLLVTELLERIRFYKRKCNDLEECANTLVDAYYDIKTEYDFFREEILREQEPIISEPPYYDTMKTTGVGEQKYKFDASPTLDDWVDLEKKRKRADIIGC